MINIIHEIHIINIITILSLLLTTKTKVYRFNMERKLKYWRIKYEKN